MEMWSRSQWPGGVRDGSAAARILGLRVRNPPRFWMSVCCEYCMLSLRRADLSFRGVLPSVVCLSVCDVETSTMRRPGPKLGCCVTGKKRKETVSGVCASVGTTVTTFSPINIMFIKQQRVVLAKCLFSICHAFIGLCVQ